MRKEELLAEILRLPSGSRRTVIKTGVDQLPEIELELGMAPELAAELERREADRTAHPERELSWKQVVAEWRARKPALRAGPRGNRNASIR